MKKSKFNEKVETLAQLLALAVTVDNDAHSTMATQAAISVSNGMSAKEVMEAKQIAEEIIAGVE